MVDGGKCCGKCQIGAGEKSWKYGREVLTEIVTLEYGPERGEGVSHLYVGGRDGGKSPNRGTARVKTLCWACLVDKN